jgi:hypothetical protein
MNNLSQSLILALSRLGEGNMLLTSDHELFSKFYPNSLSEIEDFINFSQLGDKELALIFIGLVRIETEMQFCWNATSPAIKLYHLIEQRELDRHLIFANWAYQYSQNMYIPFGFAPQEEYISVYEMKGIPVPEIIKSIHDTKEFTDVERRFVFSGMICPYCGNKTQLVDSAEIYHGKSYGMIYRCAPCDAYVSCNNGTHRAMGVLSNKPLRDAKGRAHYYFDQLWKPRFSLRPQMYKWLSETLSIPIEFTHIGMSNVEQCNRIVDVCIARLKEEGKM